MCLLSSPLLLVLRMRAVLKIEAKISIDSVSVFLLGSRRLIAINHIKPYHIDASFLIRGIHSAKLAALEKECLEIVVIHFLSDI